MKPSQRFCMTIDLRDDPELISDYVHWHQKDHIWPEIPAGIKVVGILQMEIYRMGSRLFMILEAGPDFDFARDMERLSHLPLQSEWEAFVSKYQKSTPGQASKDKWNLMEKIFTLD
jgi:L-rhamnose mutarotase